MVAYNTPTNNYANTRYIVSQTAGLGNYTSIQAASTAAPSGSIIGILPGTYTEDLTLKAGQTFISLGNADRFVIPTVTILGKSIDNGVAVDVSFQNINLQTNSDYILVLTANSSITYYNCAFNFNASNGFSCSSGSANIFIRDCYAQLSGSCTPFIISAGDIWFYNCNMSDASSTVASTIASGSVTMDNCQFSYPISIGTAGDLIMNYSTINTANTTCITSNTALASSIYWSYLSSGSASAVVVTAGTVNMDYCHIKSSNANQIAS